jgi:CarD family transcriptional regulator
MCYDYFIMDGMNIEFQVEQKVVYPSQGVGKITSIENRNFKNNTILYYIVYFEVSDMVSMIPVGKARELGLRPIVSPEEAERALRFIGEKYEPTPTPDWKLRYQANLDMLKRGDIMDIATIVRSLYHRSQVKDLPIMERKLYDSALKLIEDEISFSLQKQKEEIDKMIFEQLECTKPDIIEEDGVDMSGDTEEIEGIDMDVNE